MTDIPNVIDVLEANFQAIIDKSQDVLVIIDFWAPWCAPCRSLTPILEKLAADYGSDRLLVAKMNTDENHVIPNQIGIRSLPTVIFLKNGEMAHQFSGAQPESSIRQIIDALIGPAEPDEAEEALLEEVDVEAELTRIERKLAEKPDDDGLRAEHAHWLARARRFDEAQAVFAAVAESARGTEHARKAEAWLYFASIADAAVGETEDQNKALADELRSAADHALARRFTDAAEGLLTIMRKSRSFGGDAGRTGLLHLLEIVEDAALAGRYRRKMATLLF